VPVKPIQKRKDVEASKNDSSTTQRKGKEAIDPKNNKSPSAEQSHQQVASKEKEKKEILVKEVENIPAFNLENEISKLRYPSP